MRPELRLPVNSDGDGVAWKVIVGGRTSHEMSRPIFPHLQPNYNFDRGVLIRVKALYNKRGQLPLDEEFLQRK